MKRKKRTLKLIGFCYLLTTFFICWNVFEQNKQIVALKLEQQALQQQLEQQIQKEKELREEKEKLQLDEYIEQLARKEYFLSRDGEIIFVLPKKQK